MAGQWIWRSFAVGLLTFALFTANPSSSLACSCAAGGPAIDVTFVGRVIVAVEGKWARKRLRVNKRRFGSQVALLYVDRFWEGPWRPFYAVVGGSGQGDCMLHFLPGGTYMIYGLERGDGPLDTSICVGSRQMEDSAR